MHLNRAAIALWPIHSYLEAGEKRKEEDTLSSISLLARSEKAMHTSSVKRSDSQFASQLLGSEGSDPGLLCTIT